MIIVQQILALLLLTHLQILQVSAAGSDQIAALLKLKRGIVDELDKLSSWKSSSLDSSTAPCRWDGIQCSQDGAGVVVGIDIGSKNLSGTLTLAGDDDFCAKFPNLTTFAADDNYFTGAFPSFLLACRSLVTLELQRNFLDGSLPANISLLSSLQYLDLSYGDFSGGIVPADFGNLQQLRTLILWNSKLQGPLPPQLGKLTKLTNLTLSYNNFGPSLPEGLRNLSSLRSLKCGGCALSGRIPAWLGELKELDFLELTYNSLSGEIPPEIFHLPKLTKLELYCNALTGEISREVGSLSSLTDIDLSSNFITGSIPEELMNIPGLALIHLWNNSFTGTIPRGIANLTALYDVALFGNMFTGDIPQDLGGKCSLEIFDVSSNNLTGEIPPGLCNGGKLWRFILFSNDFTGGIPPEYGSCDSLIRVRIHDNSLSGEVPASMWGKPNMVILDLSDNQLSGPISENIGLSLKLQTLKILGNQLEGPLPKNIGRLKNLNLFIASGNQLSGNLPGELGSCSNLSNLLLDGNLFQGVIPSEIGELQKLQYLSLAKNLFSGRIPREIGELFNLISLDLSENQLSGKIPPELSKLRLSEFTHFNVSYNRLSGAVPFDVNSAVFGSSFIGNPGICVNSESCGAQSERKKDGPGVLAWIAGVVLAFAALVSVAASCWFYRKYKSLAKKEELEFSSSRELVWTMTPFQKLNFSEEDVLASLDEDNVIGCGGAGKVYKASLKNGQSLAVKKLWSNTTTKELSGAANYYSSDYGFRAEIESLGRIRHLNVVRLLCCCSNGETNILVYDYMPNGSLGDLLHSTKASVLDWAARYRIAIGAAQGLSYLHHDCVPQILHRDVKSNNILLSEGFDGMLADFGLARLREGTEDDDGYSISSLTGSLGYIAPEYANKLKVNEKSDIYSFGVVLLELLTGRRPVDSSFGEEGTDIVRWVCGKIQSREDVMKVFDSRIVGATPREMMLVLKIALHCTSEVPAHRPSMRDVVRMLKEVESSGDLEDFDNKKDSSSLSIKVVK